MSRIFKIVSGTILALCQLTPVTAGVVHKWIDANGITHYSDEAPGVNSGFVTRIDVPESSTSDRIPDDYYSISNQWQRLHRERIERDKLALEKARQQAARSQQESKVVYVEKPAEKSYHLIYLKPKHRRYGHQRTHYSYGHPYGRPSHKSKKRRPRAGGKRNRSGLRYYSRNN